MTRIPIKSDRIAIVEGAIHDLEQAIKILKAHHKNPDKGKRQIEEAATLIAEAMDESAGIEWLLEHYFS